MPSSYSERLNRAIKLYKDQVESVIKNLRSKLE